MLHFSFSYFLIVWSNFSRCGSLWVYTTWKSLNFLDIQINVFRPVCVHYLTKYLLYFFFPVLFQISHYVNVGVLKGVPQVSEILLTFYAVFFLLSYLKIFINVSSIQKLCLSSINSTYNQKKAFPVKDYKNIYPYLLITILSYIFTLKVWSTWNLLLHRIRKG